MFWVKMYQNSVKMIKKRNFCFALSVLCFALLGHRIHEMSGDTSSAEQMFIMTTHIGVFNNIITNTTMKAWADWMLK